LQAAWINIVSGIESSTQIMASLVGYRSCMVQAGVPQTELSGASSVDALGNFLAWESGQETQARSATGRAATDRRWALVFVRCAKTTVTIQERLQSARRTVFLAEHNHQIQTMKREADALIPGLERQYGITSTG
jgi:hypothetical protein